ncbi:MAG: ribosome biogenesis GTPase Der [Crocinitomicaceae bacterium]|jgi:GTP-binding protein|nr:ribosome biogenesis GTPase Der [Crocinitomicaceae bacterium]MDP4596808.1 ribosome biogenesis GTPase Der [Crocinitomicaceae bacterium]MDP4723130.1 ribosome biogenesis GTPase Der [Crocinitomicaceae bacterium]MDP4739713.1 ribosome biogenesis GTPase Der [Crocinitomicaceae bacterium]MDP4799458.1 ribosome biogenesis GTPase Der [Crocinitomicaceae bacterium]
MSNIVAIVGRPNVGKSTLFNRLTESRDAIVKEVSGVTRDRLYGKGEWNGYQFSVIDTGGYATTKEDVFEGEIRKQVQIAIEEATVIVFMVDVMTGIGEMDQTVAQLLRKSKKPVLIAANKVDNTDRVGLSSEFYAFGLGEVFDLSAANGSGTGEILDELVKYFNKEDESVREEDSLPRIAIVGRPNVGKSSMVNALTGQERNIVTDISGTTRDSIHTRYKAFGFDFLLIDTAGIRKKAKVTEDIEYYSVLRSVRTIENADVCMFMIDAAEGIQKQDLSIFYMCEKNSKGVVVLVNKWDLIEKDQNTMIKFEANLREQLAPFNDVPIIFTSAIEKQRIHKALETAMQVFENRTRKIPTHELNEVMLEVIAQTPPPAMKGKYIRIKFVQQLPTHSPSFAFFCNLPQYLTDAYKRFLENRLREHFNFEGVPIRIFFRKK